MRELLSLPFQPSAHLVEFLQRFPGIASWFDILMTKPRAGWLWRGIPAEISETIGEHSLKLSSASRLYALAAGDLDGARMEIMAYLHDIGEAIIPDITMHDGISREKKFLMEREAVERISASLGPNGGVIMGLWLEQEQRQTRESQIVHQLDQLDGFVMAVNYYKQGYNIDDYIETTERWLKEPSIHAIYETIFANMDQPGDAYDLYVEGLKIAGSHHG